jgi:hypothetical protein
LYDEQRGAFLVQYPIWLILTLGLLGFAAFAITGLTGYNPGPPFGRPWILFLWFCALVITLQASIFRNRALRRQLIATLIVTVICIALVSLVTFGALLPEFIRQLNQLLSWLNLPDIRDLSFSNPWIYTLVNALILGAFWINTLRRWLRRTRGLAPDPRSNEMPSFEELISGDLIAGAVLAIILAILFSPPVAYVLAGLAQSRGVVTACTVSLPGACLTPTSVPDTNATLTFIDTLISLSVLVLGLLIAALSAVVRGLSRAETSLLVETGPSVQAISGQVGLSVLDTLRSAIGRWVGNLTRKTALSLRTVAWPLLILLCIYGVGQVAFYVQQYSHSAKSATDALFQMGPALLWGVGAALALVASAALLTFHWRVADNSLRFLGLVGFVLLLTFWIFSLALAGFNLVLLPNLLNVTELKPFYPPGVGTPISLAALATFGSVALVQNRRYRVKQKRAQTTAILRDKEEAGDFDVLLVFDQQYTSYVTDEMAQRLRERAILPLLGERDTSDFPQVDQARSVLLCLGKQGSSWIERPEIAGLMLDVLKRQIPLAVAILPSYKGAVPDSLRRMPIINLRRPGIKIATSVETLIGKAHLQDYQSYIRRKEILLRALQDPARVDGTELGDALLHLMGIGDPRPQSAPRFRTGAVWSGQLPKTGLRLPTSSVIIFIRTDATVSDYQEVLKQRAEDGCVIVIDIVDRSDPATFTALAPVWIRSIDVAAMLKANRAGLGRSVKRLIVRQVNAGLYPYKTYGVGTLFFGRTKELKRLSDDQNHGGIIIGAHRSGKTNLLYKLQTELLQRQRIAVGPFTFAGTLTYQEFFERVQTRFEQIQEDRGIQLLPGSGVGLALENFDSTIRGIRSKIGQVSFLIDEVDSLLEVDEAQGSRLTKIMRTLVLEGQADFYLAGHSRLRTAIARQESPLRNLADEVTLTGLDEQAAVRLIQEPMEQLGYIVAAEQAHRIYRGTAGVAWLIQSFCIALLNQGEDQIDDAMIQRVESDGSYLSAVWDHFQYGLDPISSVLMLHCAAEPESGHADLMTYFSDHSLKVSRSNLDQHLDFLVNFGVLQEDPPGSFSLTSLYLQQAIEARDPAGLLTDYLDQARKV